MRAPTNPIAALVCAAVAVLATVAAASAPAIPDTPAGHRLELVLGWLRGEPIGDAPALFDDSFLEQVPADQLDRVMASLRAGPFPHGAEVVELDADPDGHRLVALVIGAEAHFRIRLSLDADSDKIVGLMFQPAPDVDAPPLASWDELDAKLDALPGRTNLGVYEITTGTPAPIHEHHGADRLAIGSTFKLWVLGALAEQVRDGEVSWDDPLPIQEELKSLPSGEYQDLDAGTERSVAQYALKMISISDNTATDHLIHLVGRANVESYMARLHDRPALNTPFLTTRELFILKLSGDPEPGKADLRDRYIAADTESRRSILDTEVANRKPDVRLAGIWSLTEKPIAIDSLEWYATPEELARAMAALRRLEALDGMEPLTAALTTNPGLPLDAKRWPTIRFKGGSEPGVMSMTLAPESPDGRAFVVSMGWNDAERNVDEAEMIRLATQAVGLLETTLDAQESE